ncbi:MAG TPA: hypothetical protein VFE71_10160, partial [Bacteroidales bacterium]|nr:hypothetical protein [Bacteroidales bacterium]
MKKIKWYSTLAILVIVILFANSCKNDKENDSNNPTPNVTVTDIDGNVYHTVTIGQQVWMVENLRTTRFRNGD